MSSSPHSRARISARLLRIVLASVIIGSLVVPLITSTQSAQAASARTTTHLNLRAGPSTDNYIKLVMPPDSPVELLSEIGNAGFYKVAFQGETGYASAEFISVGGNGGSDPGWGNAGTAYTTSALNLRSGPGTDNSVVLVMPEGASITLTGAAESGFVGAIYNGANGWASGDFIAEAADGGGSTDPGEADAGTAYTTSSLNLRRGPGTSNAVVLVMPEGASVTLTGDVSGGFAGVRYNGTSGWASQDYLSNNPPGNEDGGNTDGSYTQDEVIAIINTAADEYGQSRAAMLQVARCESLLDPYAVNPYSNASGLFQFLPGTWATTPFANQSIFDPVANARAAGWMWSVGRRGEWVC